MATPTTTTNQASLVPVFTAGIILTTLVCGHFYGQNQVAYTPTVDVAANEVVVPPAIQEEPAVPELDYEIIPGQKVGDITPTTTYEDLIRLYGAENIQEGDIYIGEGMSQKGTIVFPDDPAKRLEILWADKVLQANPSTIRITGSQSNWKTKDGITLGMTLKDLEAQNGKPFKLLGFGWDYGGVITTWDKGNLDSLIQKENQIFLHLNYPDNAKVSDKQWKAISGEKEILSSQPTLQKLNPSLNQIVVAFVDLGEMFKAVKEGTPEEIELEAEPVTIPVPTPTKVMAEPSAPIPLPTEEVPGKEEVPDYLQKYLD